MKRFLGHIAKIVVGVGVLFGIGYVGKKLGLIFIDGIVIGCFIGFLFNLIEFKYEFKFSKGEEAQDEVN